MTLSLSLSHPQVPGYIEEPHGSTQMLTVFYHIIPRQGSLMTRSISSINSQYIKDNLRYGRVIVFIKMFVIIISVPSLR